MDFTSVPQEDRQKLAGVIVNIYNEEKNSSMATLYSESNGSLYFRMKDKKGKDVDVYIDSDLDENTKGNLTLELDLLSSVYQRLVMAEQYVEYEKVKDTQDPNIDVTEQDVTPQNPGQKFVDAVNNLGDIKPTALLSSLIASGAGDKIANALKSVVWVSCTVLLTTTRLLVPLVQLLGQAVGGAYKVFNTTATKIAKNFGSKTAKKFAASTMEHALVVQGIFANGAKVATSVSSQLALPVIVTLTTVVAYKALTKATKSAASSTGFFPLRCLPSKVNALPGFTNGWSATLDCNDDNDAGRSQPRRSTLGIGFYAGEEHRGDIASWYNYKTVNYLIPNKNYHYHAYSADFCFPTKKGHKDYDAELVNANRQFNHSAFSLFYKGGFVIPFASEASALAISSVLFEHDDAVKFMRLDEGQIFKDSAQAWRHTLANFCGFKERAGAEFLDTLVLETRAGWSISGRDGDTPRTYVSGDYGHVPDFFAKRNTTFIDVPRSLRDRWVDLPCCYSTLICYFSRCFTLVSEYTAWLYNTIKLLYGSCIIETPSKTTSDVVDSDIENFRYEVVNAIHRYVDDTDRAHEIIEGISNPYIVQQMIWTAGSQPGAPNRDVWYRDLSYVDGLVSRFVLFYDAFLDYIDVADEFLFVGYENEKLKRKARGVLTTTFGVRNFRTYKTGKDSVTLPSFPFCILKGRYLDEFDFFDSFPFMEYETKLNDLKSIDAKYELFKGFKSDADNKNYTVLVNFGREMIQYRDLFHPNLFHFAALLNDRDYSKYYRDYLWG